MSGRETFLIARSNSYERSLASLLKKHYKRPSDDRDRFQKLLEGVFDRLSTNPRVSRRMGRREPWPKGTHRDGWELWKGTFSMPGLRGQAQHGRLVYLIDCKERVVIPVLLYTHVEYATRPPEKDLKRLLKQHTREQNEAP